MELKSRFKGLSRGWINGLGVALILLSASVFPGGAQAAIPTGGGNGNDMPAPFLAINQKVELADGERYVLAGRILEKDGFFYFRPDFGRHSWLSNGRRMQWPYYPFELSVSVPSSFVGKLVRFSGRAVGRVIFADGQYPMYMIFLMPEGEDGISPLASYR